MGFCNKILYNSYQINKHVFYQLIQVFCDEHTQVQPWYCVVGSRLLHSSLNFYNVQHLANIEYQTDNIFSIKLTMFTGYIIFYLRSKNLKYVITKERNEH